MGHTQVYAHGGGPCLPAHGYTGAMCTPVQSVPFLLVGMQRMHGHSLFPKNQLFCRSVSGFRHFQCAEYVISCCAVSCSLHTVMKVEMLEETTGKLPS